MRRSRIHFAPLRLCASFFVLCVPASAFAQPTVAAVVETTSAAFLNYVTEKHDKELVRKVNKALREGEYREELWKTLTKKTLKELDEDWRATLKKGAAPLDSPPVVNFYDVPDGKAEVLAKTLQSIFPKARFQHINPTRLFVFADPQTQLEIRVVIDLFMSPNPFAPPNPRVTEIIRVKNLDAQSLADSLNKIFLTMDMRAGSSITANKERNALVVRGTPDEIKEVKMVLEVYDALVIDAGAKKEPLALPPNVRIIHVDDGHAETVAEAMRKIFPIMYADEKSRPRVTIVAAADSVVVLSDDARALSKAVEIARLMQTEVPQCEFEVITLKHAKAADIVEVLDEVYNSRKNAKGERVERVRVLADAQSNAVLVRGGGLDRIAIRNLVTRTLDVPPEKK